MFSGLDAGVPFEMACGGNADCSTCHMYAPVDEIIESEKDLKDLDKDELYKEPDTNELDCLDLAEDV